MRIIVCGGRDYSDWEHVRNTLDEIAASQPQVWAKPDEYGNTLPLGIKIITGAAKGADDLAAQWAAVNWTQYKEYPANWKLYGRAAGPLRNEEMLLECPDLVVAYPGKNGTANMVKLAKKAGCTVIFP